MKNILFILFLSFFTKENTVKENTIKEPIKSFRDYEICVQTDNVVKYQVRDNRDNSYYGITNNDIDSWTEDEYQWFKTNFTITGILLEEYGSK